MPESPLISAEELNNRLDEDSLRIFDCRFSLKDPAQGIARYREAHIPGAMYANLDEDLSRLATPHAGRHPLPPRGEFRAWLESKGVGDDTTVVCYDDLGGVIAARFWWMARWVGVDDVRLLDGGLDAWRSAGFALDDHEPRHMPGRISETAAREAVCGLDEVVGIAGGESELILVDAREAARFEGKVEPLDPVAGHIPRSRNAPSSGNLAGDKRFLDARTLRERYETLLGANQDPRTVVHSCGSGVTACHNLLAMEIAGLSGSRLFPGSWSQWVDDPSRPIATGPENTNDKED